MLATFYKWASLPSQCTSNVSSVHPVIGLLKARGCRKLVERLCSHILGRDCSGQYCELAGEARQLANVITDLEDIVKERQLSPSKTKELLDRGQGCKEVLGDLQTMLTKYESLSNKSKKIVDRLGWDYEGGRDLRDRLTANVVMLNQFYQSLISSSVFRLESAMEKLLKEFQRGSRDADSVSILTGDDASGAKDSAWDLVIQDLEDLGITSDIVNQHRAFVVQWFTRAVREGELAGVLPGTDLVEAETMLLSDNAETSQRREADTVGPENLRSLEGDEDALARQKRSQSIQKLSAEIESLQMYVARRIKWGYDKHTQFAFYSQRVLQLQDRLERLKVEDCTICDECDSTIIENYYHCNICQDGDFDLCASCFRSGMRCLSRHHTLAVHEWSHGPTEYHRVLREQLPTGNDDSDDQDDLKSPPHFNNESDEASMPSHLAVLVYFAGAYYDFLMPSNIQFQSLVSRVDLRLSRFTNNSIGADSLQLKYRYRNGASMYIDSKDALRKALLDSQNPHTFDTMEGEAAVIWLELTRA